MIRPERTRDLVFPPTHPRRLPGEPHLRAAGPYSHAEAVPDPVLIEVPGKLIALYRLPWPLTVTAAAWADAIDWPDSARTARPGTTDHHQSVEGRLADVLFLVKTTTDTARPGHTTHRLTLWRVPPNHPTGRFRRLRLTVTVHRGDNNEPLATLAHSPRCAPWWQRHPLALAAMVAVLMFGPALALLAAAH